MMPLVSGYVYGTDGVRLLVQPEGGITWGMWGHVIRGLRHFGEIWEFVMLEFEIWNPELEEQIIGVGRLWVEL